MKYCKTKFADLSEMREFVDICENEFNAEFDKLVKGKLLTEKVKFIILSGPTCSGKTTVAKKIRAELEKNGKRVFDVSIDDFFYDVKVDRTIDQEVDFESIHAVDLDLLSAFVSDVSANRKAKMPVFDFLERRRVSFKEISSREDDIFIFEGIQAMYPEITALLRHRACISIYISAGEGITVGDRVFEPNEIRLMRRIVRDHFYRDSDAEYTFFLWKDVRKNEDANIFSNIKNCDIILSSTMGYEINMLSGYLGGLLEAVPSDSIYRKGAEELLEKIGGIEAIPQSLLPDCSMYFEFLKR